MPHRDRRDRRPSIRDGHSVVEAARQASELAASGKVVQVLELEVLPHMVKLFGYDDTGNHVFYTECSPADAVHLREILGATGDITDHVKALTGDGMSFDDARDTLRLINAPAGGQQP